MGSRGVAGIPRVVAGIKRVVISIRKPPSLEYFGLGMVNSESSMSSYFLVRLEYVIFFYRKRKSQILFHCGLFPNVSFPAI